MAQNNRHRIATAESFVSLLDWIDSNLDKGPVRGARQWSSLIFGLAGSAALVATYFDLFGSQSRPLYEWVAPIAISSCFGIALLGLIIEEFRWHRKARYAEAQSQLHDAFHSLRDAFHALITGNSDEAVRSFIQTSLQHFAGAFSLITGVHCRVCIKDIICVDPSANTPGRRYAVSTLIRSDNSPEPTAVGGTDWVWDNSDFLYLYQNPNEKSFFEGNILKRPGYKNSHCEPPENLESLSYRSVCVWPVRKRLLAKAATEPAEDRHDLIAFLCVDSMSRHAFKRRYDIDLGAAFADTLYQLIKLQKIRERNKAKNMQTQNRIEGD